VASPTVSVILPVHNRSALLGRSAMSVLVQQGPTIELIVVDDGSDDKPGDVLDALNDGRVRLIQHSTRRGAAAARNTGMRSARGEFIAFMDSDDEWMPGKLQAQVTCMRRSSLPKVGIVTCGHISVRSDGRESTWIPRYRGWVLPALLSQKHVGIGNPFLLIRRVALMDHAIEFDEELESREEWDLAVQLSLHVQLDFVAVPLVRVHHHAGERVWTAERALRAGTVLHRKHQRLLERNRAAHGRFHLRNAATALSVRRWEVVAAELKAAVKAAPADIRVRAWQLAVPVMRRSEVMGRLLAAGLFRWTFN
jgi:O-antigen biosynthesis protein